MNVEKYSRVYAEVDLDAIRSNIKCMKNGIDEQTKIIGVIKTDGYGHGAIPIARELEPLSCMEGFAVATPEEAFVLRKAGIQKNILVLGYSFPYSYKQMIKQEIQITIFKMDMLTQIAQEANHQKHCAKIQIKVDTGMNRIGIRPDQEGLDFVKQVMETEGVALEGIFTHFARADEKDKSAVEQQLKQFLDFVSLIESQTGKGIPLCHCSNSAGIVEVKAANMNAVRAGITLYGMWPSEEVDRELITLVPAMQIKSRIVFLKEVESGVPVGYGGTFVTDKKTKIATIPVGYGDGYPRGLSGKGEVLVRGKRAKIMGRICMDQFMIDVTDIPDVSEGDAVILVGKDQEEIITMEEVGNLSGRFNYELACCIGKRVPRVYIKEGNIVGTKDYFDDFL